jgi:SH3 domain-containing YSC84-like protein 1
MNRCLASIVVVSLVVGLWIESTSSAQSPAEQTVLTAVGVLDEIMNAPATSIPQNLLADAQGLAIIPGVIKGGFIVGVRHGRGVVMVRDQQRAWQPPVFVSLTGGSVGWQAGVQATDVILVFRTAKSVQGLMSGKFTIGADAAVAAGPVGRQAAAATDAQLRAEILSYSRSRGLFAGVSLDGSMLQIDQAANQSFYQGGGPPQLASPQAATAIPASAVRLMETVARHTDRTLPAQPRPQPQASAPLAGNVVAMQGTSEADLRRQLVAASPPLQNLLDDHWRQFLALPVGIQQGADPPGVDTLQQAMGRFDTVAKDPQFATLAGRPEFQTVHHLLRLYLNARTAAANSTLNLPPPPNSNPSSSPSPLLR